MYFFDLGLTPFEAGKQVGSSDLVKKNRLFFSAEDSQKIPQGILKEKKEFAAKCEKICRTVYPSILEEMEGFCSSSGIAMEEWSTRFFTIYAFPPFQGCTCLAVGGENGYLARNSDFLPQAASLCSSYVFHFPETKSFFANSTTPTQMEDGVNEDGLAVGLTFLYPTVRKPGLHAGLLVRYLLEHCQDVPEAIKALKHLPISSMQTLTLADKSGRIAVVECNCEEVEVVSPNQENFLAATNHLQSNKMCRYQTRMPDLIHSQERLKTVQNSCLNKKEEIDIEWLKKLFSRQMGFLCQYQPEEGMDTLWSVIYDLKRGEIHLCPQNPWHGEYQKETRFSF